MALDFGIAAASEDQLRGGGGPRRLAAVSTNYRL